MRAITKIDNKITKQKDWEFEQLKRQAKKQHKSFRDNRRSKRDAWGIVED